MKVTQKLISKWKRLTRNNYKLQLSNGKSYNGEWKIIEHFYHPKYEWQFYATEYYPDEQKFYGLNRKGKEGYFSIDEFKEFNKTHEPIVRDLKWKHPMVGIHFKWKNMKNWRKYESKII
mgnify:CR=1 FL=1